MVVLYGIAVQDSIVLDWSYVSVLFPDEEKRGSIGRFRGANIIAFSLFVKEFVESTVLMSWHRVDFAVDRTWGVWEKINSVVPFSRWGKSSRGLFAKYLLVTEVFWGYELFKFGLGFSSRLLG